ncbi:MAG: adenine deaminase, partial [Runella slithyformis]
MRLLANLINLFDQTIYYSEIEIENGIIAFVNPLGLERPAAPYALPGFIDSHVHIESSMLTPAQFARLA